MIGAGATFVFVLASCTVASTASDPANAAAAQDPAPAAPATVPAPVLRERKLGVMGTSLEVRAIGPDPARLDAALDAAVAEIQRVENLMTDWRPSPLETLNAAAGKGPQLVSREIADVVRLALEVGALSDGAFDITFASVGKLWDFKSVPPRIPTDEELTRARAHVDYSRVKVDLDARTVDLPAGMRIGLGGIAKGYGVDRAMKVLMDHGVEHAIVNAGGDLKALGSHFDAPWEIAIVHPRDKERVLAVIPVKNTCVVTSGDYERFFEIEGVRYHHILDPRTGRPSQGCMSATVTAPDAALADALATAMCVLGPVKGLELIERLPRVGALLVDMQGRVHTSSRLRR